MLRSEVQHQFWITKKAVQKKLGAKEDHHVISSDANLDLKIEVFKSILETSAILSKIIDQYQERICMLSQEESVFGRFLKEVGKRSKTTGFSISNTGKAISYSGQQRMTARVPLLRLQHEVEIFRNCAVRDTQATIQTMEKERTEYRAALAWMKSASSELDPDTGKGLEKYRVAQSHVRQAKQNFDSLSMDSIQKIDLLAAARCNMFSHALQSYMQHLKEFATKAAGTFEVISNSLANKPKFDFHVLKDLSHNDNTLSNGIKEIVANDKDQSLYFADDYSDAKNPDDKAFNNRDGVETAGEAAEKSTETAADVKDKGTLINMPLVDETNDLLGYDVDDDLENEFFNLKENAEQDENGKNAVRANDKEPNQSQDKPQSWVDLFAHLDPIANPEAFNFSLHGGNANFQQT